MQERHITDYVKVLRVLLPVLAVVGYYRLLLLATGPLPGWLFYLLFGGVTQFCIALFRLEREQLGLSSQHKKECIESLLYGAVIGLVTVGLLVGLFMILFGHPRRFLAAGADDLLHLLKNILYYLLLVSPVEELLFRGYLQYCLEDMTASTAAGILLQAVLFCLWHWPGGRSVLQVVFTFVLGLIYGCCVRLGRRRGLPAVIAAHGVHNVVLEFIRFFCC